MPCFASWALWFLGRPDRALDRIQESLTLARELSEPHGLAHALFFATMLHHLRRDNWIAQHYAQATMTVSREHGLVLYLAMATVVHGWTVMEQGREQEAIVQLREGVAALDETGTSLVRPHFLGLLAQGLAKVRQYEEALSLVEEATAMVSSNGERYYEAELYRLKGELLLTQADPKDIASAEQCLKKSIQVAESQNAKSWQLRTAISLARLYQSQDRTSDARNVLAPAYDWFTEGFDTSDLRDAKTLLEQLSPQKS